MVITLSLLFLVNLTKSSYISLSPLNLINDIKKSISSAVLISRLNSLSKVGPESPVKRVLVEMDVLGLLENSSTPHK